MWHCQELGQGLWKMGQTAGHFDKDIEFVWGPEQEKAMGDLKQAIIMVLCL